MHGGGLLTIPGYRIEERRHAGAILQIDYPDVLKDLGEALAPLQISHGQVIEGGGGKSSITLALEAPLRARLWGRKAFSMSQTIDGRVIESTTHEIDHFKEFDDERPGVALEIEWNNKDPFYDRDLGTFARLHLLGVISLGILITRGPTLQDALRGVFVERCESDPAYVESVIGRLHGANLDRVLRASPEVRPSVVAAIVSASKYGEATTHWRKLMERIERGLGNPCPLLLVGIEAQRLHG
jgi:hypothetical protein